MFTTPGLCNGLKLRGPTVMEEGAQALLGHPVLQGITREEKSFQQTQRSHRREEEEEDLLH